MSAHFFPGMRVKVKTLDRSRWAAGAPKVLEGLVGTVESIDPPTNYRHTDLVCVRFDAHTRGHWHRNANPRNVAAFHFEPSELESL